MVFTIVFLDVKCVNHLTYYIKTVVFFDCHVNYYFNMNINIYSITFIK